MLTEAIAQEIVKETMRRLQRNINIMDEKGIIIASGDLKRRHQLHFGAVEVIRTGMPVIIHQADVQQGNGALPGVNLPIQFQNEIIGVIGITGNPDDILEFGELVKMITEMMLQQTFLTQQSEWKQNMREFIFDDLLTNPLKIKEIKQRLHLIGVILEPEYQVAIVEFDLSQSRKSTLQLLIEHYFQMNETLIGFLNVNRLFILTTRISELEFSKRLLKILGVFETKGIVSRIGMGSRVSKQAYIIHAYEEAICALKHGSKAQPFITYAEIETKALLDQLNTREKVQFSNRVLVHLSEKLIETLESFFANNLNIGVCAKELYIHRNSLVYRIKKVKEQSGYDPQQFQDALTLQLAIWIWRMEGKQDD